MTDRNYNNCQNFDFNEQKNRLLGKVSNSELIYLKVSDKENINNFKQFISLDGDAEMDEIRHIAGLKLNYFVVGCLYKVFLMNGGIRLRKLFTSENVYIFNYISTFGELIVYIIIKNIT